MYTSFEERFAVRATCISNEFLDSYMAEANGDYVKVYLYMLRHRDEEYGVQDIADALDLTDNDIARAVRYWEKKGIFSEGMSQLVDNEIHREQCFAASEEVLEKAKAADKLAREQGGEGEAGGKGQESAEEPENAEKPMLPEQKLEEAAGAGLLEGTVDEVKDSEEFAGVLFVARHVLPALPTQKQVQTLAYMYKELSMSADLIEFLLEYCAGLEKTSSRYMETVAINWHEDGICTVAQAQKRIREFEQKTGRRTAARKAKTQEKSNGKGGRRGSNKFLNFDAVDIDYDSIAQKKVLERMQNVT